MALTSRLGRPMLAAMFVGGGLDSLRHPAAKTGPAEEVGVPIAERLKLPTDPELLVQINGAVHLGAGLMLATGKAPRLAALALAASLVPTTFGAHRFWEHEDPGQRTMQRVQFLKNVSMMGGLLLAAGDTEGRPSLAWRGRHAARAAASRASAALPRS